jgi:hypothetical protein
MAETVWETGKLRAVWHPIGKRANGEQRFRRANFDVLQWASTGGAWDTYIVPLGTARITNADVTLLEAERIGTEFGYYDIEPIVIDVHESDGRSDSWKALHSFGYI